MDETNKEVRLNDNYRVRRDTNHISYDTYPTHDNYRLVGDRSRTTGQAEAGGSPASYTYGHTYPRAVYLC